MSTVTATKTSANFNLNGNHVNGGGFNSRMENVREEVYAKFNQALEKTKEEVNQMKQKLEEYDEKLQASQTLKKQGAKASEYFHTTLEEIKTTLDNLSEKAKILFSDAKEFSMDKLNEILKSFQNAVDRLKQLAVEFDKKYELSRRVSDLFSPLFARLKTVEEVKQAAKDMGEKGRSFMISTAANLDTKYQIETKLSQLDEKYNIVQTANSLQKRGEEFIEKHNIKENLEGLDEKLTGSKAGSYLEEGVKLLTKEWEKIHEDFEIARKNSKDNLQALAQETAKTK